MSGFGGIRPLQTSYGYGQYAQAPSQQQAYTTPQVQATTPFNGMQLNAYSRINSPMPQYMTGAPYPKPLIPVFGKSSQVKTSNPFEKANTSTGTPAATTDTAQPASTDTATTEQSASTTDTAVASSSSATQTKNPSNGLTFKELLDLQLYGTTPRHPNWMNFYAKVCDNDEKPVKVAAPEGFTFADYDEQ